MKWTKGLVVIVVLTFISLLLFVFAHFRRTEIEEPLPLKNMIDARHGPIRVLAFSPDERLLVIGNQQGDVCVCNPETSTITYRFTIEESAVTAVAFSPAGSSVFVGYGNGATHVWDLERQASSCLVRGTQEESLAVQSFGCSKSGSLVAVGLRGGQIRIFQDRKGVVMESLQHAVTRTDNQHLLFLDDENVLACGFGTANKPAVVQLCHLPSNEVITKYEGRSAIITAASVEKRRVALREIGKSVEVIDLNSTEVLTTINEEALCMAFDKTGTILATSAGSIWNRQGRLSIWTIPSGRLIAQTKSQRGGIYSISFSPFSKYVAVGGSAGTVEVFRLRALLGEEAEASPDR
jgi:WD40 repeat protein